MREKLVRAGAGTLTVWLLMTAGSAAQGAIEAGLAAAIPPPRTESASAWQPVAPADAWQAATPADAWQPAAPADASQLAVPADASQATTASAAETGISAGERLRWAIESSVGPTSLGVGVISAAWGVARDSPDEYGASWGGFGKRYALRLSGVTLSNSIEAGLGAAWDEDPRYQRGGTGTFWSRVGRAGKWTVLARRPDGRLAPAYARAVGIVSANFITNAWRVDSDRSVADALSRSAIGASTRFLGNVFLEFWPDVRQRVFRREP